MRHTICALVVMLAIAFPARVGAEGTVASLAAARELYVAASYDDALSMLGALAATQKSVDDQQSVDLYRTLCLFALGRAADADRVIETMLMRDPLYRSSSEELSPRVQAAFQNARKRILPAVIQKEYADAKGAFDKQDWPVASKGFDQVLKSIADPDIAPLAGAPPLSDIKTLASGFRDLSVKMIPPPAPKVESKPVRPVKSVYTVDDRDVVPPVAVQQRVPRYPAAVTRPLTGVIELVIDQSGLVQTATMVMNIDPSYDQMVTGAAKKWTYQPATLEGKPVKYIKRLTITVTVAPQ